MDNIEIHAEDIYKKDKKLFSIPKWFEVIDGKKPYYGTFPDIEKLKELVALVSESEKQLDVFKVGENNGELCLRPNTLDRKGKDVYSKLYFRTKNNGQWIANAYLYFQIDRINDVIELIKSIGENGQNGLNDLSILSWNLGVNVEGAENYQSAWKFDQVATFIIEKSPSIICLQEVPEIDSTLGKYNYFDRMRSWLESQNYLTQFALKGGMTYFLTAIKRNLKFVGDKSVSPANSFSYFKEEDNYYKYACWLKTSVEINNSVYDIYNVHLPSIPRDKAIRKENYQKLRSSVINNSINSIIAGDLNLDIEENNIEENKKDKSGAVYYEDKEDWRDDKHLDYIFFKNEFHEEVEKLKPETYSNIAYIHKSYIHRPVTAVINI